MKKRYRLHKQRGHDLLTLVLALDAVEKMVKDPAPVVAHINAVGHAYEDMIRVLSGQEPKE